MWRWVRRDVVCFALLWRRSLWFRLGLRLRRGRGRRDGGLLGGLLLRLLWADARASDVLPKAAGRALRAAIDFDGLCHLHHGGDGVGRIAHGGEVLGHALLGHGGDLCPPEEWLQLLSLEVLLEIMVDDLLLALRLAIGVGEDFAVGEFLYAQMRGWVDLLGGLGGFDSLGVVGSSVGGVGLLESAVLLLFGLNGASGAAIGALIGCGGLHRGRRGLGRHGGF